MRACIRLARMRLARGVTSGARVPSCGWTRKNALGWIYGLAHDATLHYMIDQPRRSATVKQL
jgi:hypothetical protein